MVTKPTHGQSDWDEPLNDGLDELEDDRVAGDAALAAALASEAQTARNADNLQSGTVPEARIPSTITRDSELAAAIAAAVALVERGEQIAVESKYGSAIPGINATGVALDGSTIVVPPSATAQILWYSASIGVTVAGGGVITLGLYEVGAGGTAALRDYWNLRLDSGRPTTSIGERLRGRYRVAPHSDYKLFGVTFTLTRDAGSSLAVTVLNGNTDYGKTAMQVTRV